MCTSAVELTSHSVASIMLIHSVHGQLSGCTSTRTSFYIPACLTDDYRRSTTTVCKLAEIDPVQ